MKCQDCGADATFHALKSTSGAENEIHLCHQCAAKRKLLGPDQTPNLAEVVQAVTGAVPVASPLLGDFSRIQCPDCGMTYMDFRKTGRVGCANDYQVFAGGLVALLDRVHRATHHTGKQPRRCFYDAATLSQIRQWRTSRARAVLHEDYETAARLRDLIKQKEEEHGPG